MANFPDLYIASGDGKDATFYILLLIKEEDTEHNALSSFIQQLSFSLYDKNVSKVSIGSYFFIKHTVLHLL